MDRTAYDVLAREVGEDEPAAPGGRDAGPLLSKDYDALDYLQAIYRGEIRADPTRMRAANMALPYERPKLSVAVTANHRGMATAMEAAHAKLTAQRLPPAAEPAPVQPAPSVASGPSFRRIVERVSGDPRDIGPMPKRKPG
jgi:hypothetical protein